MLACFARPLTLLRFVPVVAGLLACALALPGCGGGSRSTPIFTTPTTPTTTTDGPVVGTSFPSGVVTGNTPLRVTSAQAPFTGKDITVSVTISDAAALNNSSSPPRVDVQSNGQSVLPGIQPLRNITGTNVYQYVFNVPAGTPTRTYTFIVYAIDIFDSAGNTPYTVGSITL